MQKLMLSEVNHYIDEIQNNTIVIEKLKQKNIPLIEQGLSTWHNDRKIKQCYAKIYSAKHKIEKRIISLTSCQLSTNNQ